MEEGVERNRGEEEEERAIRLSGLEMDCKDLCILNTALIWVRLVRFVCRCELLVGESEKSSLLSPIYITRRIKVTSLYIHSNMPPKVSYLLLLKSTYPRFD